MRARTIALVFPLLALAACSASPEIPRTIGAPAKSGAPSVTAAATASPEAPAANPHRHALATPPEEALPVELVSMAGGARVLAIADEGERGAWARTLDANGSLGKIRRFTAAHAVTAFDGSDGRTTFVTSDGDRLCLVTYAPDKETPDAQGCETLRPEAVVPIGERLALLSLEIHEAKSSAPPRAKSAAPATKKASPKKAGSKAQGSKKTKAPAPKKPKKHSSGSASIAPIPKAKVDVRIAWATREGAFEQASALTGVAFERPLAGMMLADVAPRGTGADLLFFEAVAKPKQPSKTALGSARLGIASLGPDGLLVPGSRGTLPEGDLEYGYITGQNGPRLVSNAAATALVTFAGRGGACQAERIFPTLGPVVLPKAACLVDPLGWALGGGAAAQAQAAVERLLAAEPRRAPGQTRTDAPLVAWAGDRGVFVGATGFGSAARSDGVPAPASLPFAAKRARIGWSAFAPDGEGIAFAAGRVFHIDVAGAVSEMAALAALEPLGQKGALARDSDRVEAARIGDGFWLARGDVLRLFPSPTKIAALAGRALPDATALVGGRERGMFLEVTSGLLQTTFVAKDGTTAPGSSAPSPVRAGFAATERAAGGALVAGVSASDATKVIVVALDEKGAMSAPHATSLNVVPGAFGVRLTAFPDGGALLTDRDRKRAVWLDDAGNERASAALPADQASASCIDGRAAPLAIPSPEPGKLVRVPDLAEPGTCITGEPAWTANGGARWFGASVRGLDSIAEAVAVDNVLAPATPKVSASATNGISSSAPASGTASEGAPAAIASSTATAVSAAPASPAAPVAKPACSGDMVSIAGRFCIDRFESMLVDGRTGRTLSPDFPGTPNLLEIVLGDWTSERSHWGDVHARAFPLPEVPAWQRGTKTDPLAVPLFGARPNGYVTGLVAESACTAAGKRLCSLDEFTVACRGESDTDFPYGTDYQDGVCNVYREEHPAALLHHNASFGHLDPRLNRVRARGRPLFETAGARPACRSVWGSDAAYDLVGNLDEWVDEGGGAFAGGFYSRSTRAGCDAVITAHPKVYADYSTGVRCCRDAAK